MNRAFSYHDSIKWMLLLSLFYRCRKWGTEIKHLVKITHTTDEWLSQDRYLPGHTPNPVPLATCYSISFRESEFPALDSPPASSSVLGKFHHCPESHFFIFQMGTVYLAVLEGGLWKCPDYLRAWHIIGLQKIPTSFIPFLFFSFKKNSFNRQGICHRKIQSLFCVFLTYYFSKRKLLFFSQYHHMPGKQGQILMDRQMSLSELVRHIHFFGLLGIWNKSSLLAADENSGVNSSDWVKI